MFDLFHAACKCVPTFVKKHTKQNEQEIKKHSQKHEEISCLVKREYFEENTTIEIEPSEPNINTKTETNTNYFEVKNEMS